MAAALFASMVGAGEPNAPRTFLVSPEVLIATRASLAAGDQRLQPALAHLIAEAGKALELRPPSVMDKPLTAASGDKHDYFSFGPYWWPDPTKPDGLPYIRRDGERNPAGNGSTDDDAFTNVCTAVETLGLAYWFTGDERFAAKAATLVRVWFLDPVTRMNPNFQHAQAIPGISDGRGIGIIEARRLMNLNEGLAMLAASPAWTVDDRASLHAWLCDFYHWLTTSANGRDEQDEANNHGTWYDAQVAHLALVLDRPAEARAILTEGLARRLATQVEPDGRQPHELARTRSLSYSLYNLEALLTCAQLAGCVDVDWWSFATPDGRSLAAALGFLAPYADPEMAWPYQQLHPADRAEIVHLIGKYLAHREDASLREIHTRFASTSGAVTDRRLLVRRPSPRQSSASPK
jgi:hypothetical protein